MPTRSISDVVGASPPREARPVSLATRDYVRRYLRVDGERRGAVIAVSGGADSLALAVATADTASRFDVPYSVAVVDHRMRPGSSQEADAVARKLRELGCLDVVVLADVPHSTATASGAPSDEPTAGPLESAARDIRYRLLDSRARTWGAAIGLSSVDVLLGHTMDDQAETVLLRLGRGASARSLAAMRERGEIGSRGGGEPRVFRGRPLLGRRRRDTEAFCRSLGLTWVDDPTNTLSETWRTTAGAPLPRTAIRHTVLPALANALDQDPVPALARIASLLAEDDDALVLAASAALTRCAVFGSEDKQARIADLADYPAAIRKRVYVRMWQATTSAMAVSASPSAVHLAAIDRLVYGGTPGPASLARKVVELPGGVLVVRARGLLSFSRRDCHPRP